MWLRSENVAATTGPLLPNCTFTDLLISGPRPEENCTEMLPVISHVRALRHRRTRGDLDEQLDIACSFAVPDASMRGDGGGGRPMTGAGQARSGLCAAGGDSEPTELRADRQATGRRRVMPAMWRRFLPRQSGRGTCRCAGSGSAPRIERWLALPTDTVDVEPERARSDAAG